MTSSFSLHYQSAHQLNRLKSLYKPSALSLHSPPCYKSIEKRVGQSPVMLIRHANSEANEAANLVLKEAQQTKLGLPLERWLQVYGNDKYIDSQLT